MSISKVLVIDDSIMIRKMVKSILADKFEVLEANDGMSGLDTAKKVAPNLILLDFVMPKYNGYQTLQALRRVDTLKDIPVIMISGLREQVAENVPEPWDFDFLEKPFEPEVLISKIDHLLHTGVPAVAGAIPTEDSRNSQRVLDRLTATETLLAQGIENLIQREVVARINTLSTRVQKQEAALNILDKKLDSISQKLEHQNKGLMIILREIKALQTQVASK
ncbi:response regulator with CheY-like receiver, AAA-type ATPase, and DNA-binding domains [Synechococcus sp. PCC 7502]|uniref:response regulator n=1 Tax=Synechococcus sp. PCC 7502 TaxID=1173263 RepID=UPI00029FC816|nr:response regulator [Synechococcus sp. PCC 7502]AFY72642.1 response regulator with CheY-like receiver, AAA-type ATPase, and DNA-binding domains [Synechococcus sp. PCC 7502]